jgi:hypothetical protein
MMRSCSLYLTVLTTALGLACSKGAQVESNMKGSGGDTAQGGSSGGAAGGTGDGGSSNAGGNSARGGATGSVGGVGGSSGSGSTNPDAGPGNGPDANPSAGTFEAIAAAACLRKVKDLLVGLAPTDADVATVAKSGNAGLKTLLKTWMTDSKTQPFYQAKMIGFFRNAFQQTGFVPTEDFKAQLLENGGFDFGPVGYRGDDAFARIVQNLQDSFAMTTWQTIVEGRPLTDVLTTKRFMLTTALKSLYLQIEMPNDQPYSFAVPSAQKLAWKIEYSSRDIPLTDTLDPSSPDYMVFSDLPPTTNTQSFLTPTCQNDGTQRSFSGYAQLFQRLLGFTQRYPFSANPSCWEHPSKPYYTTTDLTDWQWVTIRPLNSGEALIKPYDLPTLRKTTTLPLNLPRVGFFTTPAYLALWATNNSNQHRVTANQTLLVALGQSFTPDNALVPLNPVGLDSQHAVSGTQCYGCHKNLDPMRQFWATQYDFNDRNDFLTANFFGGVSNPRPSATGGVFAFDNINQSGSDINSLSTILTQVMDQSDPNQSISRFAISMAQKLCYYANSSECLESDPEFRRVAQAFAADNFNFSTLVTELFASPLVTAASDTATFDSDGVTISISRRDHLCAALSNRLGQSDICALAVPQPSQAQAATLKIAGSVAADAFSRGSQTPVTPSPPTLFYRAASELLCENVAALVVDASSGGVYSSSDVTSAVAGMVQNVMGYPPGDSHYASAVDILTRHYNAAKSQSKTSATNALRATFALACQSPTSLIIGM